MRKWTLMILFIFAFLSFTLSGCYYFSAKNEIKEAEKYLAELKAAGGDKKAPYEYCSAESYLYASKLEFDHNDYKVAKGFATQSKSASQAGLEVVKKK
ncbi:MAG: hypothetical protein ACUVTN_03920 [Thermodesulfobacteriota bacterium]